MYDLKWFAHVYVSTPTYYIKVFPTLWSLSFKAGRDFTTFFVNYDSPCQKVITTSSVVIVTVCESTRQAGQGVSILATAAEALCVMLPVFVDLIPMCHKEGNKDSLSFTQN